MVSSWVHLRLFRSSRPDYIETLSPRPSADAVEKLFRSSRPDYIETLISTSCPSSRPALFRSSRPDYIETWGHVYMRAQRSELFRSSRPDYIETMRSGDMFLGVPLLFRSSRPDYIETALRATTSAPSLRNCSGLPDRTTLRPPRARRRCWACRHCSGLPDRTTLRPSLVNASAEVASRLFRSSRPDYIETHRHSVALYQSGSIVPVFQTGLH